METKNFKVHYTQLVNERNLNNRYLELDIQKVALSEDYN